MTMYVTHVLAAFMPLGKIAEALTNAIVKTNANAKKTVV